MSANGLQATYSLKICLTLNKPGSCLFRGLRELKPSFYRSDRSHCFWVSYTEEILPTWLPKWLLFSCIEPTWKLLDQTSELHCLVCVSDSSQNQMSQRKMQYLNLYKKQFWNNMTMARWTSLFLTPFFQKHHSLLSQNTCSQQNPVVIHFKRLHAAFPFYTFDVLCLTFMEEEASIQPLCWFGHILPPLPRGDVFVVFWPPTDTKEQLHWTRCLWKTADAEKQ